MPVVTLSPVMCTTGHWLSYVAHMPWAMRPFCCNTLVPAYVANVMFLLHAQALQVWDGVDNCPWDMPVYKCHLCTYAPCFAGQQGCGSLGRPESLLMQPLKARCMPIIAAFQDGDPLIATVLGRCKLHALQDEMIRCTLWWSALLCSMCVTGTLPCSV